MVFLSIQKKEKAEFRGEYEQMSFCQLVDTRLKIAV